MINLHYYLSLKEVTSLQPPERHVSGIKQVVLPLCWKPNWEIILKVQLKVKVVSVIIYVLGYSVFILFLSFKDLMQVMQ